MSEVKDEPLVIPAKIRKLAESRKKGRAERVRQSAKLNIATWMERVKEDAERMEKAEERAAVECDQWAEALARLKRAGFKPEINDWNFTIEVQTNQKRLTALYHAIGRLDPQTLDKEIHDAKKREIKVSLRGAKFPNVKVIYVRKLSDTDKCKIESVEVPATTEHRLVCRR